MSAAVIFHVGVSIKSVLSAPEPLFLFSSSSDLPFFLALPAVDSFLERPAAFFLVQYLYHLQIPRNRSSCNLAKIRCVWYCRRWDPCQPHPPYCIYLCPAIAENIGTCSSSRPRSSASLFFTAKGIAQIGSCCKED